MLDAIMSFAVYFRDDWSFMGAIGLRAKL